MSKYNNALPADFFDDEDVDDYDDYARPPARQKENLANELQKQNTGIKIIKELGSEAGLNKSDFDIKLDANAQQWFDQIHQYWRQCKLIPFASVFFCLPHGGFSL